jgi:hypothetical protein
MNRPDLISAAGSQKWAVCNNPSIWTGSSLIFVIMHRSRYSYLIEVIIHGLFWAGVYYALRSLTTTSFNMMIRTGDQGTQTVAASVLFRYFPGGAGLFDGVILQQ